MPLLPCPERVTHLLQGKLASVVPPVPFLHIFEPRLVVLLGVDEPVEFPRILFNRQRRGRRPPRPRPLPDC